MPAPVSRLADARPLLRACIDGLPLERSGGFELEAQAIHLGIPPPRNARRCGSEPTGRGCSPSPVVSLMGGTPRISWIQTHTLTAGTLWRTKRCGAGPQRDSSVWGSRRRGGWGRRCGLRTTERAAGAGAGLLLPASTWLRAGLRRPLGEGARGFVDYVPGSLDSSVLDLVPPDLVARNVLWGAPERIASAVERLTVAGMQHVNLAFGPITSGTHVARLVTEAVDAIRNRTSPARDR
jgi:hypothetical protein